MPAAGIFRGAQPRDAGSETRARPPGRLFFVDSGSARAGRAHVRAQFAMRLVAYSAGRWALVPMSATRVYSKLEVEMLLTERMAGRSEVSLDFSGQFVPVSLSEEVPLVASLLTAYHNSVVMANIQVLCI